MKFCCLQGLLNSGSFQMPLQWSSLLHAPRSMHTGCFGQRVCNKKLTFHFQIESFSSLSFSFFVKILVISDAEHLVSSSVTHCSVNTVVDYKISKRQKHLNYSLCAWCVYLVTPSVLFTKNQTKQLIIRLLSLSILAKY